MLKYDATWSERYKDESAWAETASKSACVFACLLFFFRPPQVIECLPRPCMKQLKKVYFPQVSSVQTLFLNNNDIDISERERPRMFSNFDSLVNLHLTNAFTENTTSSYYLLSFLLDHLIILIILILFCRSSPVRTTKDWWSSKDWNLHCVSTSYVLKRNFRW